MTAVAVLITAAGAAHADSTPQRIVSLTPAVTETLFAIGEGASVVGVSQYCDYPPAAAVLPEVGSFLTPNVEAIAALRPTLIIGPGISSNQREMRALAAMGYPVMTVDDDTLSGIERGIVLIGDRTDHREAAAVLLAKLRAKVSAVTKRLAGVKPRTVVMVVGHQPMVAVGPGTFLDELLRLARAKNIADATVESWPRLSLEYIIARRPDVILDGSMGDEGDAPGSFWSRYQSIPAVRNHRVYGYPQDPVLHPGPRFARTLEILAALVHPEAFATGTLAEGAAKDSSLAADAGAAAQ